MAVLVGAGAGYWVDRRWGTTPYGVIVGVVIGFAAMVLRLLRLGREVLPEADAAPPGVGADADTERGPAESPALSDVWQDDASGAEDRKTSGTSGTSGKTTDRIE
jgi:hypothetical protein